MLSRIAAIIFLLSSLSARAAEEQSNDKANGSITPYIDIYYLYNFNEPFPPNPMTGSTVVGATPPSGNNALRVQDVYHNQFSLSVIEFTVQKSMKSTQLLADFDFGQSADINARQLTGALRIVDESTKHIGRAVVIWRPENFEGLTVEAGKMHTHVGFEAWKAKDNWQYSRTLMHGFGQPGWHSGVRALYDFGPGFHTGLALYNGWNNFYDTNAAKTLGLRLGWDPAQTLSLTYNFIGGAEQDNESVNQKHVHELNAVWDSAENVALAVQGLYGSEQNVMAAGVQRDLAIWSGWALFARWKLSDWHEVNPRIEWYNDNHGYTLGNGEQKVWSATVTEAYHLADGLQPRVEARYDRTSADGTFSRKGASVADQFSITLALLYTPDAF